MRNAEYPAEIVAWDHTVHFEFEQREANLCASIAFEQVENSGLVGYEERMAFYRRAYEQTQAELYLDLTRALERNT